LKTCPTGFETTSKPITLSRRTPHVTRKTRFLVPAAAALLGLAVVAALWWHHGSTATDTPAPPPETTPSPSAQAAPADQPPDPQMLGQIREAYQKSLAEDAPPGMVELMQGPSAGQPGDLPPLPDPFVVPAGAKGNSAPSADLPPLPPPESGKPKPLPSIDSVPAADKAPKEGPAPDLPPLPPVK
jgi:hypothetical protein